MNYEATLHEQHLLNLKQAQSSFRAPIATVQNIFHENRDKLLYRFQLFVALLLLLFLSLSRDMQYYSIDV